MLIITEIAGDALSSTDVTIHGKTDGIPSISFLQFPVVVKRSDEYLRTSNSLYLWENMK